MKVSELGEFGLIDLIAGIIGRPEGDSLLIGIGDDAAVWSVEGGLQLSTIDSLIEGVHFALATTSWRDLGWKSLAVNLSDIAAMGGRPRYALVSLGLPGDTDVESVVDFYHGMIELARRFDVQIAGGDTVGAPEVVINVTATGEARDENSIMTRSAAKPGDAIAVTGSLGASAAGLAMIRQELSFDAETTSVLRAAHTKPNPRVTEGLTLARHGVKAAMDISDGLAGDLEKLCKASGVSARIYAERIPIHPAVRRSLGDEALELALSGGEDYELLFTAPAKIIGDIEGETVCPVTIIGEIVTGAGISILDADGNEIPLGEEGWDHFSAGKRI